MKNFASASFFRLFDLHVRPAALSGDDPHWSVDGVDWTRSRHSFRNPEYGQTIEVFVGVCRGRKPWKMMIVHEIWWVGPRTDSARTGRWAHFISGDRLAALEWFKARENDWRSSFSVDRADITRRAPRVSSP